VTTPRLQGKGFWNDPGVSSHTVRSVHTHQRAKLRATDVSYGTSVEHGLVFPHGPAPWNPAKRDLVENVQENWCPILFVGRKTETPVLPAGSAAFITTHVCGGLLPRSGKARMNHRGFRARLAVNRCRLQSASSTVASLSVLYL